MCIRRPTTTNDIHNHLVTRGFSTWKYFTHVCAQPSWDHVQNNATALWQYCILTSSSMHLLISHDCHILHAITWGFQSVLYSPSFKPFLIFKNSTRWQYFALISLLHLASCIQSKFPYYVIWHILDFLWCICISFAMQTIRQVELLFLIS